MWNKLEEIPILKKGGIHIKKKNRGKFTESANRVGMGVQEFANHVLANKDKYSPTLVKRANFARNAKKFKHENGGILKAQQGTRNLFSIKPGSPLDQAWQAANEKLKYPGVKQIVGPDGNTHVNKSGLIDKIKLRLYNNISPSGYYTPFKRVWNAIIKNKPEVFSEEVAIEHGVPGRVLTQGSRDDLRKLTTVDPFHSDHFMDKSLENDLRNALWAKYLGLTDEQVGFKISDYIEESPYKPPHAKDGEIYYRFNPKLDLQIFNKDVLARMIPNKERIPNPGKNYKFVRHFVPDSITVENYPKTDLGSDQTIMKLGDIPKGYKGLAKGFGLGTYTVGANSDNNGDYISYYDEWDINPFKGDSANTKVPFLSKMDDISIIGTPIKLYDRQYK